MRHQATLPSWLVIVLPLAAIAGLLALVLSSCTTNFDRQDQIKDLRVLAVKTEPAEILYSPELVLGGLTGGGPGEPAPPLPAVDVDIEITAADPRGGALQATLVLCPENSGDDACRDFGDADRQKLVDSLPEEDQAGAEAALAPLALTGTVNGDSAAKVADGLTATVALPASLLKALLPSGPGGAPSFSLSSALPRFGVVVENSDAAVPNRERAFKRLPLTLDLGDPSLPAAVSTQLLSAVGTKLCTSEELARPAVVGTADCYRPAKTNENPGLLGFLLDHDANDAGVFTDADADNDGLVDTPPEIAQQGAQVKVSRGATVTIDPVFTAASFESYQGFRLDIQTGKSILENRVEDLAIDWFATTGDVGQGTTSQQAGGFLGAGGVGRLGTTWQASTDRRPGDHDTILCVVYDQRGGIAVGRIEVEY